MVNARIENYTTVNCYIDTSYKKFDSQEIMISSFSSEDGNIQEEDITSELKVKSKDGYVFKDPSKQSFNLKIDGEWKTITLDMFVEPEEQIDFETMVKEDTSRYWALKNVDVNNSLIYKVSEEKMLVLLGGFSETFLYISGYEINEWNYDFQYQGKNWGFISSQFSTEIWDRDTGDYYWENYLENLNFVAESETTEPIEDTTKYLFKTYYIESSELSTIPNNTDVYHDVIINTYSYPLNVDEQYLTDVDITIGGVSQNYKAKRFLKNLVPIEIFKYNVGDFGNVEQCYLNVPFNNEIKLEYENIRNKTITGTLYYEVLTNTTTLVVDDGSKTLYRNVVSLGVKVPYKPTGQLSNFEEPNTRLALSEPKLYLKSLQETEKTNYLKGFIKIGFSDILKEELEILNNLVEKGVYIND